MGENGGKRTQKYCTESQPVNTTNKCWNLDRKSYVYVVCACDSAYSDCIFMTNPGTVQWHLPHPRSNPFGTFCAPLSFPVLPWPFLLSTQNSHRLCWPFQSFDKIDKCNEWVPFPTEYERVYVHIYVHCLVTDRENVRVC